MIARLTDDHVRIRAIATTLDAYLDADQAPADPAFARSRWELMRELATHLACERHAVGRLRDGPAGQDLARGLDVALDEALRSYMLEWTGARLHGEWHTYRIATRALLRRLAKRMAYEESTLFPLLH